MQLYLSIANRSYGPYSPEALQAFLVEGRIRPQTAASPHRHGPWSRLSTLMPQIASARPAAGSPRSSRHDLAEDSAEEMLDDAIGYPAPPPLPPRGLGTRRAGGSHRNADALPGEAAERDHFVIVQHATDPAHLHRVLRRLGTPVLCGPGVWFLRAGASAAAIRTLLSRELSPRETLIVVEAAAGRSAWFNLPQKADEAIRRMQSQPASQRMPAHQG